MLFKILIIEDEDEGVHSKVRIVVLSFGFFFSFCFFVKNEKTKNLECNY